MRLGMHRWTLIIVSSEPYNRVILKRTNHRIPGCRTFNREDKRRTRARRYLSVRKMLWRLFLRFHHWVLNVVPHSHPKISLPANTPVHRPPDHHILPIPKAYFPSLPRRLIRINRISDSFPYLLGRFFANRCAGIDRACLPRRQLALAGEASLEG